MENNKYQYGKIYKIVSNVSDKVYYGSTCEKQLSRRLASHRGDYKKYQSNSEKYDFLTSFKILEEDNYDIVLVEEVNCNSKEQLHARERFYIENNECINKVVPQRTRKERYNDPSTGYAVKTSAQQKVYAANNRGKIHEIHKRWRDANKEKLYYHHPCECGREYQKSQKSRHCQTKYHQNYLKTL